MNSVLKDKEIAKWHLAVNLWEHLARIGKGYKWLADELTSRTGETIYPSRVQNILHQTNSPEWAMVLTIAEILECSVESLGKRPSRSAEKAYRERFPTISANVA